MITTKKIVIGYTQTEMRKYLNVSADKQRKTVIPLQMKCDYQTYGKQIAT